MLTDEAAVTMPPMASWYRGKEAIRVFLTDFAFAKRWVGERERFESADRTVRLLPLHANGQIAFAAYNLDPEEGIFRPYALQVLTLEGDRIAEITGFVNGEGLERIGLPPEFEG